MANILDGLDKVKIPSALKGLPFNFSARADALLYGMRNYTEEVNKLTVDKVEAYSKKLAKEYSDFRKEHDSLLPNIHIIDKETFSDQVIFAIQEYFFKVLQSILITEKTKKVKTTNKLKPFEEKQVKISEEEWLSFRNKWDSLKLPSGYWAEFTDGDQIDILNYAKYKRYIEIVESPKFIEDIKKAVEQSLTDLERKLGPYPKPDKNPLKLLEISLADFRNKIDLTNTEQVVLVGQSIKSMLGTVKVSRIRPSEVGLDNENRYIVIYSPNFIKVSESLKPAYTRIENNIKAALKKEFGVIDIYLGNLINLGHAGVRVGEGNSIIANTPGLSSSLFNAYQIKKQRAKSSAAALSFTKEIARVYKTVAKVYENSISIDKKYSNTYLGIFMSIGGTITLPELALPNQRRGRTDEKAANTVIREMTSNIVRSTSSRSILQYIVDGIDSIIEGKPIKGERVSKTRKNSFKITNLVVDKNALNRAVNIHKNSSISASIDNKSSKKAKAPKISPPRVSKVAGTSIVPTLQVLLDANLTEQIKQNMKKPALQNRTGRFAESVKVERLSESRAGMISIFYNYMKNPYSTFSSGGEQFSTAREPKTLIAKSIREVASQLVGNRLRSISI